MPQTWNVLGEASQRGTLAHVLGLVQDDQTTVRAAAVRCVFCVAFPAPLHVLSLQPQSVVGVLVLFRACRGDPLFVLDAAAATLETLQDGSEATRSRSSWALGNLADALAGPRRGRPGAPDDGHDGTLLSGGDDDVGVDSGDSDDDADDRSGDDPAAGAVEGVDPALVLQVRRTFLFPAAAVFIFFLPLTPCKCGAMGGS